MLGLKGVLQPHVTGILYPGEGPPKLSLVGCHQWGEGESRSSRSAQTLPAWVFVSQSIAPALLCSSLSAAPRSGS